ncbi:MAG TPA: extracellular solute-binding protein, partial [Archangium sp.]
MLCTALCLAACSRDSRVPASGQTRVVFVHQPLWGDPAPFTALLDDFRRAHPEIALETQLLPNDSDVAHQYFLTSLEGGSADLDVFVADVVWVPEFARAGWIVDLTEAFPLDDDFLPGARDAVTVEGKTWAV